MQVEWGWAWGYWGYLYNRSSVETAEPVKPLISLHLKPSTLQSTAGSVTDGNAYVRLHLLHLKK